MNTNFGASLVSTRLFVGAFFALFLFLSSALSAQAAPAWPGVHTISQPDGKILSVQQFGDEWSNGVRTLDGHTIVKDEVSGFWKYAEGSGTKLKASALTAGVDSPTNTSKNLRPTPTGNFQAAPVTQAATLGTQPVLVIFADFTPSVKWTTTAGSLNSKFFGATNSVAHYYQTVSYGAFTFTPATETNTALSGAANDGIVAVTLGYAHPNTGATIDDRNRTLARDAILAADPFVNFAQYDTNGNGSIAANELHVVVMVAGAEHSYGGGTCGPSVWGHRWGLGGAVAIPTVDGKSVGSGYTEFGEMDCDTPTSGREATIGIMVHELGHDLGLPDLYDIDQSSEGAGRWSVMASGSWSGVSFPGDSPSHFDPWSKFFLGWITPTVVTGTLTNESITQSATAGDIYQFLSGTSASGEYFLVENRQKTNYDAGLPGAGLLIWHIDAALTTNQGECYPGGPSCATQHYKTAVVQADNLYDLEKNIDRGDTGDPFPGSTANTNFTAASNPNSNLYSGAASNVSITNIGASGATMTATLQFGSGADTTAPTNPTSFTASAPSVTQINLSWSGATDNVGVTGYDISRDGVFLVSVGATTTYADNGSFFPNTLYQYTIKAKDAAGNLSSGVSTSVTTPAALDLIPPSAPTNLLATPSATQVALSWTASTDNVGVTGYKIFRDGIQVGTSATTNFTNTSVTAGATYAYVVKANDAEGNTSADSNTATVTIPTAADIIAPSKPTGMTTTPGPGRITFSWNASTDNVGVTGYDVFRNNVQIGTTPTNSYVDTTVVVGTLYNYKVRAYDAAGNKSALTAGISGQTTIPAGDTTPPSTPSNLVGTPSATQVALSWTGSTDNVGVAGYRVYKGGVQIGTPTGTTFTDTSVTAGATYAYTVKAIDAAGNLSATSNTANVTIPAGDTTPPTSPSNLVGTPSAGQVSLTWTAATDNVGVAEYRITRTNPAEVPDTVILSSTTNSFVDTSVTPGQTYVYSVLARDAAGNQSFSSNPVQVVVPSVGDTTPPSTPTNLVGTPSGTQVALSWTGSTDNVGVTGYKVYRGGVEIASVTTTAYTNTGLTAGTYQYTVKAFDAAGNLSATSNTATAVVGGVADTTAPSKPTGMATSPGPGKITFSWNASTDNVGVTGYEIIRNSVQIGTSLTNSYVDTTVAINVVYTYKVRAYDAAGNRSALSNGVNGKTTQPAVGDTTPPSAPSNLVATPSTTEVALSWTASTDNVGVTGYQVFRDGAFISAPTGTTFADTSVTAGATYAYTVKAIDAAGNLSATSNTANATIPGGGGDTQAPTVPTNLAASAPSSSQVNLSWTGSTDNVGVTGYKIYRGGVEIGTSPTSSYTDTTVVAGTAYSYFVQAYDAANNTSASSNTATVTTPTSGGDTTPPSTPTNLVGTPSGTQVALSWTGSTDNVGVTGYKVYRGGVEIASVTTTAYTNTGLTAGTYQYTVKAFDAAGNLSATSNTATVTVASAGTISISAISIVQSTFSSSVQFKWTTNVSATGTVKYGISPTSLTSTLFASTAKLSQAITGSPFTKGVTYYYQINATSGSNTGQSAILSFTKN